jgi:hypothetical protein
VEDRDKLEHESSRQKIMLELEILGEIRDENKKVHGTHGKIPYSNKVHKSESGSVFTSPNVRSPLPYPLNDIHDVVTNLSAVHLILILVLYSTQQPFFMYIM